jgi:hypothetical protein
VFVVVEKAFADDKAAAKIVSFMIDVSTDGEKRG